MRSLFHIALWSMSLHMRSDTRCLCCDTRQKAYIFTVWAKHVLHLEWRFRMYVLCPLQLQLIVTA